LKIFRIAKTNFIEDLSGEGARLYGGRWNKPGDAVIYFSEHLSLCVLEILTRTEYQFLRSGFSYLEAEIPYPLIREIFKPAKIHLNWNIEPPNMETQMYGSNWLRSKKDLAISIPSAVLPQESNVLVNPAHSLFSEIKIMRIAPLILDSRIIQ